MVPLAPNSRLCVVLTSASRFATVWAWAERPSARQQTRRIGPNVIWRLFLISDRSSESPWVRIASSVQAWVEDVLIGSRRPISRLACVGRLLLAIALRSSYGFASHPCTLEAMRTQGRFLFFQGVAMRHGEFLQTNYATTQSEECKIFLVWLCG